MMRPIGSHGTPTIDGHQRLRARRARWRAGATLLIAGSLIVAGCSSDDATSSSPGSAAVATTPDTTPDATNAPATGPDGELVVDVSTLGTENFIVALGHEEDSTYTSLVNETLVYLKHDTLEFEPGLATSWTVSPDGLAWTFKLRDGVTFHNPDGSEAGAFTSADVKFTIETAMGPTSNWYALNTWTALLKSVETPDPLTVVINLNAPYPGLIGDFASSVGGLQIQSKAHVDAVGLEAALTQPVGTGPYVLKSQQRGSSMSFEALPEHWRVVPEYKTITFDLVPEETTRVASLKSGDADIAQLSGASLPTLDSSIRTQQTPDAWTSFISIGGLYSDRPEYKDVPYADANVRKALALAIDRDAIAKTLYGGAAAPATSWGLYPFSNELTAPAYDPDQAKQLLKDAGWPSDYVIELWVQASPQLGDVQTLTEAIAGMWDAVGVKTKIVPIDAATAQQRYQAFDVAGTMSASAGRFWFDPQPAWQVLFHSGALYESFYTPELDTLIDDLAATIDPDARLVKERAVVDYMIAQTVVIPLVTGTSVYGFSDALGEWPALRGPLPLYLEYTTHPTSSNLFRLFEP
jgi:peptide/nickel transport system substrate-binding protein